MSDIDPSRIKLERLEPHSWQHALRDRKPATRWRVLLDGKPIGEVSSHSEESWATNASGRIRTRMRGYARTWHAQANPNTVVTRVAYNRTRAIRDLVEYHTRKAAK